MVATLNFGSVYIPYLDEISTHAPTSAHLVLFVLFILYELVFSQSGNAIS